MSERPEGIVPGFLTRLFGPSWKTTLAGIAALVAGVLPSIPGLPPVVYEVARVLAPIAAGGGLLLAKDRNVTGKP